VFDHVIIEVADLDDSRGFYERTLAPLGISVVMELVDRRAFGDESGRLQFSHYHASY
jgi:catechol 2,3-dioxygenase-like lactoylglutathione lyase family enzyme